MKKKNNIFKLLFIINGISYNEIRDHENYTAIG